MPLWIWLSSVVSLSMAIGQLITQRIKDIEIFRNNFWAGITTFTLNFFFLYAMDSLGLLKNFSEPMRFLWLFSLLIGVIFIGSWSFNLMAYKNEAYIALKKLTMNGIYLTLTMAAGVIFFGESLSVGKILGVVLFFVAFVLADEKTWNFFRRWSDNQS